MTVQNEGSRTVNRKIKIYNLDMIIAVGYRIKSPLTTRFKTWAKETLNDLTKPKNALVEPIIKFEYEDISLDVSVSPEEEMVWLTQEDMGKLFNVNVSQISRHITNIFADFELEIKSNLRKTQIPFSDKMVNMYSLDVILAVGYRVKSKRGIEFRKWANRILKEYLLNGHVINEDRCTVCASNIMSLQQQYNKIESRLNEIEEYIGEEKTLNDEIVFYTGEFVEAYFIIKKILFNAKNQIIIIDNYADSTILELLKGINTKTTIITSDASYIKYNELKASNISIIKAKKLHSRYIISDEDVYVIDNSFNNVGKRQTEMFKSKTLTKNDVLNSISTKI